MASKMASYPQIGENAIFTIFTADSKMAQRRKKERANQWVTTNTIFTIFRYFAKNGNLPIF